MINKILRFLGAAAFITASLQAGSFSFTGTFSTDDQVQLFNFTIGSTTNITLHTLSYGGGTNVNGAVIAPGGFDTSLTIYNSDGSLFDESSDDANFGCAHSNSDHGVCLDDYFNDFLNAGSYTLALTESGNGPAGPNGDLSDGFSEQGMGNFTDSNCPTASTQGFCDSFNNQDDGHWALDITSVTSATEQSATPEPVSFWLFAGGLAFLGIFYRRQKSAIR